ncbi:hypothetical protein JKP88DRAFT_335717 [Tribonema minus]|uniref:EF-hand domain-containing protein n=1 Tax=Tribonema minus TaxID=303371 RepID=A0A835YSL5_9STRA|nr:hypothetical protein JKP88DRAFT_335717 [Tribonema minus]
MGCTASHCDSSHGKNDTPLTKKSSPSTPGHGHNANNKQVLDALRDRKWELDHADADLASAFSFAKIVLKLGTIKRVLRRVQSVYTSCDADCDGKVSCDDFKRACQDMRLGLEAGAVDKVFAICGVENSAQLSFRDFTVMLAVARVMRVIPGAPISSYAAASSIRASAESEGSALQVEVGAKSPPMTREADRTRAVTLPALQSDSQSRMSRNSSSFSQVKGALGLLCYRLGLLFGGKWQTEPTLSDSRSRMMRNSSSFSLVKWARIPSLNGLVGLSGPVTPLTGGAPAESKRDRRGNVQELRYVLDLIIAAYFQLRYVLDLIIAAYFQFDSKVEGFISRRRLEQQLEGAEGLQGSEPSTHGTFLYEEQWQSLWGPDGKLSFQDFVYIFSSWIDFDSEDPVADAEAADDVGLEL